jgi:hypothetical protein
MGGTRPTPEARRLKYVARALAMNPLERADEIVQLRNRCLGIRQPAVEAAAASSDVDEKRENARMVIDHARKRFWNMDLRKLKRDLNSLQLDEFPDLQHAAFRLQVTADYRHLLPRLAEHRDFDPDLFAALKKVFVCPPRDAGDVKERTLQSLGDPQRRRRSQRMARLLGREFPELYDLEEDWLDSIIHYKPRRAASSAASSGGGGDSGFLFGGSGWAMWIVVVLVLKLLRLALSD